MNLTVNTNHTSTNEEDILLPLCEIIVQSTNSTNSTTSQHVYNQTQCRMPENPRKHYHTRVKTYHMQPHLYGQLSFYSKYDPFTGIRTASILGSFLFLVVVYGLYKAKCKKKEWTSQDRLFVERYKKRFNGRKGRRGTDFAFMHEPFTRGSGETSVAMEQTAKWIQSQPLQANVPKQNFKSGMGNLCLESFKATIYPVCDTNNINHMPNGNIATDSRKPEKNSNAEVEIKKLNEKNLNYQNLWKSRSYDDKVNMQTISTMSSLGDLDIPYCDQDINLAGDCGDALYEPAGLGLYEPHDSCPIHNSLTDSGLSASRTDSSSAKPGSPLYRPFPKKVNGEATAGKPVNLPMLQPITVTPPLINDPNTPNTASTLVPAISFSSSTDIPIIDIDHNTNAVSFKIGTPSSCSSLDNDECFSLTTTPMSINDLTSSIVIPINQTIIPSLPSHDDPSAHNNVLSKSTLDTLPTPLLSLPNDLSPSHDTYTSDTLSNNSRSSTTPRPSLTSLTDSKDSPKLEKNLLSASEDEKTRKDNACNDSYVLSQVNCGQNKSNVTGATAAKNEKSNMAVTQL